MPNTTDGMHDDISKNDVYEDIRMVHEMYRGTVDDSPNMYRASRMDYMVDGQTRDYEFERSSRSSYMKSYNAARPNRDPRPNCNTVELGTGITRSISIPGLKFRL